jgi:hypothetical protein
MIAEEQRPLAGPGNLRRLLHGVGDGASILDVQRHEDARHQGKVIGHVALIAVSKVGAHVGRHLIGLGQQQAVRSRLVHVAPEGLDDRVRFRQVLAGGAFPLHEIGHGIEAEAVHAEVEPEIEDPQHFLDDSRIVVIEIRFVVEEAVPVIGLGERIP